MSSITWRVGFMLFFCTRPKVLASLSVFMYSRASSMAWPKFQLIYNS